MTRLALLVAFWSVALTTMAIGLEALSRIWRPRDAILWHAIWRGFVLAACAGIALSALTPTTIVVVTDLLPVSVASAPAASSAIDTTVLWASVIFGVITSVLLLRLLAGWLRVHRIARLAWPVAGLDLRRFQWPGHEAGEVSAECRAHDRVSSPLTVGWRRPLILLPTTWRQWPAERLAIILRHELAHVGRRDYLWNLIAALAETALWFVPGLRLAAARMRLCAELAADDAASAGVGRVTYAQHLLETAAGIRGGGRLAAFSLAPGVASSLKRRVDALLDSAATPGPASRAVRSAALVLVVVLVVAVMSLRAAGPDFSHSDDHRANHRATHSIHLR